ncbi:MAG: hypothetical protein EOO46_19750, partial [Flavobacterium sp.]
MLVRFENKVTHWYKSKQHYHWQKPLAQAIGTFHCGYDREIINQSKDDDDDDVQYAYHTGRVPMLPMCV